MYNDSWKGGGRLTVEQKIKVLLAHAGISQAELARRLGTSASNLNQKIKRNSLTQDELTQIATEAGAVWDAHFMLPDGTKI